MKKLLIIFGAAFLLNLIWENLHAPLYVHYQGGAITQLVLLRAALVDALFITGLALPFLYIPYLRERTWYALLIGLIAAILLERFALTNGRWAYTAQMPIVPLLNTGLTPTIQLGLLSYGIFRWRL